MKSQDERITKAENSLIIDTRTFHHIIDTTFKHPHLERENKSEASSRNLTFIFSNLSKQDKRFTTIYQRKENMFSGIVEEMAEVVAIEHYKENIDFTFKCSFTNELKIDQSVAHNGVCLTVVRLEDETYTVTAMKETLERSNLGLLSVGERVNIERSMLMNGRLDGHIVQGHVDETAKCVAMENANGSTYFTFEYKNDIEMARRGYFTVDKGSVTVNGVSLTVCEPSDNTFKVAIIPYTLENTNFADIKIGSIVNLEFDILGKYIARLNNFNK